MEMKRDRNMKQQDMFNDELKQSRLKAILSKAKFWGRKSKQAAEEIAENEVVREIGTASKEALVDGIKSQPMKHVMGGAVAGAIIGTMIPVPFVGTITGAGVGGAMGLYAWFTKA
jgi:hypothetical protein